MTEIKERQFVSEEIEKLKAWEKGIVVMDEFNKPKLDKQKNTIPVKDPFGPATYVTEELRDMAKKAAQITVRYDGMDEIQGMLDDHTFETLKLLDEGSRAVQAHANGVVNNFDAFIREGPVKIKYDKGDVSGKEEAEEEYAQASQHYLNHVWHIVMEAEKFGEVNSSLNGAIALLNMQTKLVNKDKVFTQSNHNQTILNLIKYIKSMQEDLTEAKNKREHLIIELRQFLARKPSQVPTTKGLDYDRTTGKFVARYKAFDPMFFVIAKSYIEYTMAIYEAEVRARDVTVEVTKIKNLKFFRNTASRPQHQHTTTRLENKMMADIDYTNASLNKAFKKLSSTATNFLENYTVPDTIKNLPTAGKTGSNAIDNAAQDLAAALKASTI